MNAQSRWSLRLGVLTELVAQSPSKLGRTALMKLAFLLQTVKGVPLDYNFRLYTYGPFDADVLNDLGQVEAMRGVQSNMLAYANGYGYEFSVGPESERVRAMVTPELARLKPEITWVLDEFGSRTAAELELISTIVYADRDILGQHKRATLDELSHRVREIKPRFSDEHVKQTISLLGEKGLLLATDTYLPRNHVA